VQEYANEVFISNIFKLRTGNILASIFFPYFKKVFVNCRVLAVMP
jgi:hypothetical protein